MPTGAFNICCPRDCVSWNNEGTAGAPLKPLRVDSALGALSSLKTCWNGGNKWVKRGCVFTIQQCAVHIRRHSSVMIALWNVLLYKSSRIRLCIAFYDWFGIKLNSVGSRNQSENGNYDLILVDFNKNEMSISLLVQADIVLCKMYKQSCT